MLGVGQDDAELLGRARAERGQQVRRSIVGCAKLEARAWGARQRPAPKLQGGYDLCGLGCTDSRYTRQIARRRSNQAMEAAAAPQQLVCNANRVDSPAAAAKHERHELVVAQRRRSVPLQLLAWTIVRRQFFHRTTVDG